MRNPFKYTCGTAVWIEHENIKAALAVQLEHTDIVLQHRDRERAWGRAVQTGSDLPCQEISGVSELPETGSRAAVLQLGHMCKYCLFLSAVATAQHTAFDTHYHTEASASKHKAGPRLSRSWVAGIQEAALLLAALCAFTTHDCSSCRWFASLLVCQCRVAFTGNQDKSRRVWVAAERLTSQTVYSWHYRDPQPQPNY